MITQHSLWTERYRPTTLKQYVFHDEAHAKSVKQMLQQKNIPHLLLSGVAGSGKTSLAFVIINELETDDCDLLIINSSDENSVDIMRDKIKSFVSTYSMGKFKIVLLEEADYITPNGQAVLRRMMEEYSESARFILTCNHENKIIPAVRSRTQHFRFKAHEKDDVTELVAKMLLTEKVKFSLPLLDKYVSVGYPDIRKIINLLQQNTVDSVLMPISTNSENGDYKFQLIDLLEKDDWFAIRKLVCSEVMAEEWEDVYRFLYENLHKSSKFSSQDTWEEGIVTLANYLYKHSLVADPELNFAACAIQLGQI